MPLALLLLLPICESTTAIGADRALEIMREVERQAQTDSQSYEGAIEVISPKGKVLRRTWHLWQEGNQGRSKMLIRFEAPADVRGVSVLSLQSRNAPTVQYLYTPSNQRVRRLAPGEKSQRFMGTDLSHEDIEGHSVEEYDYKLVGEQDLLGQAVFKIRAVCKYPENTQYSWLIMYVRKDIFVTAFVEFYVAGRLRKTMTRNEWNRIQDVWTPLSVEVKDLARGSITRIHASSVQYHQRFHPDWFTVQNLRKTL